MAPTDARMTLSQLNAPDGGIRDPRPVPDRARRLAIVRRLFKFARQNHWGHKLDERSFKSDVPNSSEVLEVFSFLLRFYDPNYELIRHLPPQADSRPRTGRRQPRPRVDSAYVWSCLQFLGFEGRLQEKDFRSFNLNTWSYCLQTIESLLNDIEEFRWLEPEVRAEFDASVVCTQRGTERDGDADDSPMQTTDRDEPVSVTVLSEFPVELVDASQPAVTPSREFFFIEDSYQRYMDGDDEAAGLATDVRLEYINRMVLTTEVRNGQMRQSLEDFEHMKSSQNTLEAELQRIRMEIMSIRSEIANSNAQIEVREANAREVDEKLRRLKSNLTDAKAESQKVEVELSQLRQRVDYQERSVDEIERLKQKQVELKSELEDLSVTARNEEAVKLSLEKELIGIRRRIELSIPRYNAKVEQDGAEGSEVEWKLSRDQLGQFENIEVWRAIAADQERVCQGLDAVIASESHHDEDEAAVDPSPSVSESDLRRLEGEVEESETALRQLREAVEADDLRRQSEEKEMMDLLRSATRKVRTHIQEMTERSRKFVRAMKEWHEQI